MGVTRTIGTGGPLDGLLSSRFLLAFVSCGLVLVSRGLVFGVVTVNYGNNNDITGRDLSTLHVVGSETETLQVNNTNKPNPIQKELRAGGGGGDEDDPKKKLNDLLNFLTASKIPDKPSLNEILKYCAEYNFNECQGKIGNWLGKRRKKR